MELQFIWVGNNRFMVSWYDSQMHGDGKENFLSVIEQVMMVKVHDCLKTTDFGFYV